MHARMESDRGRETDSQQSVPQVGMQGWRVTEGGRPIPNSQCPRWACKDGKRQREGDQFLTVSAPGVHARMESDRGRLIPNSSAPGWACKGGD